MAELYHFNDGQTATLLSLQGLGNSIINLPVYYSLATKFHVRVICFKNGSAAMFRSFGISCDEVSNLWNLVEVSFRQKSSIVVAPYPNWRRERLAQTMVHSKYQLNFENDFTMGLGRVVLNTKVDHNCHDLENNFKALAKIGLVPQLDIASKLVGFDAEEQRTSVRTLCIHPTASTVFKYYPLNFWVELIEGLDEFEHVIQFCGLSEVEKSFCRSIENEVQRRGIRRRFELCAGYPLVEVAKKINRCASFVGLDSALMHLAALLDKPCLGLWSFADYRRIYPYGNNSTIYVPIEVKDKSFVKYPNKALPWIKRASAKRVVEILRTDISDFRIFSLYKKPIRAVLF